MSRVKVVVLELPDFTRGCYDPRTRTLYLSPKVPQSDRRQIAARLRAALKAQDDAKGPCGGPYSA